MAPPQGPTEGLRPCSPGEHGSGTTVGPAETHGRAGYDRGLAEGHGRGSAEGVGTGRPGYNRGPPSEATEVRGDGYSDREPPPESSRNWGVNTYDRAPPPGTHRSGI